MAGNNHGPVVRLTLPLATRGPSFHLEELRPDVIRWHIERGRARGFQQAHTEGKSTNATSGDCEGKNIANSDFHKAKHLYSWKTLLRSEKNWPA